MSVNVIISLNAFDVALMFSLHFFKLAELPFEG